jgi:hypothetical protein
MWREEVGYFHGGGAGRLARLVIASSSIFLFFLFRSAEMARFARNFLESWLGARKWAFFGGSCAVTGI